MPLLARIEHPRPVDRYRGRPMANIALAGKARLSAWRHLSLGTWRTAYDPSIYGSMTLRMDESLRYIATYRKATGRHLTVSHLMALVGGRVLHEIPEINAVLRWNSIYLREKISVFFQVAIVNEKTGAIDLSGLKLDEPHNKTLSNIIDEFEAKAARIRVHKDKELDQSRGRLHRIPAWFIIWSRASSDAAIPHALRANSRRVKPSRR